MKSNVTQRMIYENAVARFNEAGFNTEQAVLSQSFLRSENNMSLVVSEYLMKILVNEVNNANTIFNTEHRLNLQDAFLMSELGIFIANPASAIDTTFTLHTYPNAIVFPGVGVAAAMETMMTNGKLSITVNKRVYVPSWDIFRHRLVPQTQDGAIAAAVDQQDGANDGFFPVEPNPILSGGAGNDIRIILPAAFAAIDPDSRIVLLARGVLAQNVTSVR